MSLLLSDLWWRPSGSGWWGNTFYVADIVLRVVMFVVVVRHRRRPVPTTLAWLVLVLVLPFVGAFLYVLVGETRLGSKRLREYELLTTEVEPLAIARWWEHKLTARSPFSKNGLFDPIAKDATALGGFPPLVGNKLELIGDTDELLRRMVRDIDGATVFVQMLFYIWMEGGLANQVVAALIRAAERGVDCRVLVDSHGSKGFLWGEAPGRMRAAGVKVYEALPTGALRALAARIDLRNHRKIAVIDGTCAYCGSQNLTDTTFHYRKRKLVGPWIDASVRVEGPAVQALTVTFLRDWAMEEEGPVELEGRFFPAVDGAAVGGAVVQVVPTGPTPDVAAMRESVLMAIYAAREELVITTPYFVPDEATMAALKGAARRGVVTTLVVPSVVDSKLVALAAQSHFGELLESGVRVLRFRDGMLHSKTMTVDGEFAMIGSANLDMRSFWLNFEVTLLVYDGSFAKELRALQEGYAQRSERIEGATWERRPFGTRALESVLRLFGGVM